MALFLNSEYNNFCFQLSKFNCMKSKGFKRLTYDQQKVLCSEFVQKFQDHDLLNIDPTFGNRKYLIQLQQIVNNERTTFQILCEDLEAFFRRQDEREMIDGFKFNTKRYITLFTEISAELMPKRSSQISPQDEIKQRYERILEEHRRENWQNPTNGTLDPRQRIPISCHLKYDVSIVFGPGSKSNVKAINQLTANNIGSLVSIKAIVVRASVVKPQIVVATYACDICGCENYQQIRDITFKPLTSCMSKTCVQNKVSGKLTFLPSHSKFRSFQQLKVQQTTDQLRQGAIPKSITVCLKGGNVKQASPGDLILLQGILLPTKRFGFRHATNLSFETHIEALKILRQKKKYVEMAITEEQIRRVEYQRSTTTQTRLFNKLSKSIAPQIFGLENVKKALLLLMTGGVTKQTHDNVKIRGQINIALIGDPGIAKSQLLKHISYVAPRAIYTTGKGSSGVGLTAAIVCDPYTKEISLEAGALVLADMGICCIDEFDKMDEYDRTAIHEVMEQQTVSIAKAGITTTLNARTSILAAANPLYGRYNKGQTPHKNINLPAALLSRFDLIFILLDTPDKNRDLQLATHIGKVHQKKKSPIDDVYDSQFIRAYIALARNFKPTISQSLHKEFIGKYVEKRKEQCDLSKQGENYTTTRSLLALIRLCQAKAKLRFSNQVSADDIQDCLQILEESQRSIIPDKAVFKPKVDFMSAIFDIVRDKCYYNPQKQEQIDSIEKRVIARGYSSEQLQMTLKSYSDMNVIMIQDNKVKLIN